jgi:NTE family protein
VPARKKIELALQGGGSHGAFTWGVLDRILEDDRLEIEAVSGASAGAVNAAVLADGLRRGGRTAAQVALEAFWRGVSESTGGSMIDGGAWRKWAGFWGFDQTPLTSWFDLMSRFVSPYDFNPLNVNPIRDLLLKHVDFDKLRTDEKIKLFITATNVETGRPRIFQSHQLTVDHIMASACLPTVYQAVVIDGVPYWDGGYMGNPSLWPLFYKTSSDDIVLVKINPLERKGAPRTARGILERLNEITFNASLLREFRAIDFVQRLIHSGRLEDSEYRDLRMHIIDDDALMIDIGESSKYLTEWTFLQMLRDRGRTAADAWLEAHFSDIGKASTVDLRAMFQGDDESFSAEQPRPTPPPKRSSTKP